MADASASTTSASTPAAAAAAPVAALDVRSALFDAEAALLERNAASVRASLPQHVFPLANLGQARRLLPRGHRHHEGRRIVDRAQLPGEAERRAEAERMRVEKRQLQQARTAFDNPLDALVRSFERGPLRMLRDAAEAKTKVRVVTRRPRGVRGTCEGFVRSFDKFMNLLLLDVDEEYTTMEYACVSSDGWKSNLEHQVKAFLHTYCPEKSGNLAAIVAKYGGQDGDRALWQHLHTKYGLLARVAAGLAVGAGGDVQETLELRARERLFVYRGREHVLMRKMGIANEKELAVRCGNEPNKRHDEPVAVHATWVRRESAKHKGRFFYFNTVTKQSVWGAPEGVTFKLVKHLAHHKRHLSQVLLRGDCVISCSPLPG